MLQGRAPWSTTPPVPRDRMQNQPTLLFSWWCTSFAAVIILVRICGRKIRSNTLFRYANSATDVKPSSEDWIMLVALIPLFIRMVLIQFVLIYRTNNVNTVDYSYSPEDLYFRSIGSRLVLPGRIFYAMFIWFCKLTVSEFLKRITIRIWRRSYELTLRGIRIFLLITFIAVVLATLTECHPFDHYWQVIPDPGPRCRLGYAHLFTMGICDIITDLLLILFPIPIVLMSGQTWQRKLHLTLLFSSSVIMIAITATRMTMVVRHDGLQQYRTVWASCEILASAATANAVILGSFVRDKGTRKNKFVSYSVSDSIDRVPTRRPTQQTYGSEEDLFRSLGCRIPEHLQDTDEPKARPAPLALPASMMETPVPPRQPLTSTFLPSPSISMDNSASLSDPSTISEADESSEAGRVKWAPNSTLRDGSIVTHDFAPLMPAQSSRSIRQSSSFSSSEHAVPLSPSRREHGVRIPFGILQPRHSTSSGPSSPSSRFHGLLWKRNEKNHTLEDTAGCRESTFTPSHQSSTFDDIGGLLTTSNPSDATVVALERVKSGHCETQSISVPTESQADPSFLF